MRLAVASLPRSFAPSGHVAPPRARAFRPGPSTAMSACALALACLASSIASAEEPRQPTEPAVMADTAVDLLEVPDAFDTADPFDVDLRLSFDHEQRQATVTRESSDLATG